MAYQKKSYVEHTAVYVKDIQWHIRFFREALGMEIRKVGGSPDNPKQVWTIGGVQLISDPSFEGTEGRLAHLGIMTEDLEVALQEVYTWGVTQMPTKERNWVALPDGLCIEILQAKDNSIAEVLSVKPWA